MKNVASIIIPVYKREELFYFGLKSIHRQKCKYPFEVIVVNDGIPDKTPDICDQFRDKLNIKYIYSGERNIKTPNAYNWRIPGFSLNIGVKQAESDIVFLTNAEIYHLDNTIEPMIETILNNKKVVASTCCKDDENGSILEKVRANFDNIQPKDIMHVRDVNYKFPFFLGMRKEHYVHIGGYDEDFIGMAYDDNDFVDRLERYGLVYNLNQTWAVHLYHAREFFKPENEPKREYNRRLYVEKNSIPNNIVRNIGREWGKL